LNAKIVGRYFDTLICDLYERRKFPKNLTNELWQKIIFIYDYYQLRMNYPNDKVTLLAASNLLMEIYNYFDGKL